MSAATRRIMDKRLAAALQVAVAAGWETKNCKAGVMVYPPNGSRPIPVHASRRGGSRKTPNAIVQMRRAGLEV